jgi:hypothetical protein
MTAEFLGRNWKPFPGIHPALKGEQSKNDRVFAHPFRKDVILLWMPSIGGLSILQVKDITPRVAGRRGEHNWAKAVFYQGRCKSIQFLDLLMDNLDLKADKWFYIDKYGSGYRIVTGFLWHAPALVQGGYDEAAAGPVQKIAFTDTELKEFIEVIKDETDWDYGTDYKIDE